MSLHFRASACNKCCKWADRGYDSAHTAITWVKPSSDGHYPVGCGSLATINHQPSAVRGSIKVPAISARTDIYMMASRPFNGLCVALALTSFSFSIPFPLPFGPAFSFNYAKTQCTPRTRALLDTFHSHIVCRRQSWKSYPFICAQQRSEKICRGMFGKVTKVIHCTGLAQCRLIGRKSFLS